MLLLTYRILSYLNRNRKRLLHPGADTKLILSQYVATIKCLRIIDPPGVLLFKVADPIRRYLRFVISLTFSSILSLIKIYLSENDLTLSEALLRILQEMMIVVIHWQTRMNQSNRYNNLKLKIIPIRIGNQSLLMRDLVSLYQISFSQASFVPLVFSFPHTQTERCHKYLSQHI